MQPAAAVDLRDKHDCRSAIGVGILARNTPADGSDQLLDCAKTRVMMGVPNALYSKLSSGDSLTMAILFHTYVITNCKVYYAL